MRSKPASPRGDSRPSGRPTSCLSLPSKVINRRSVTRAAGRVPLLRECRSHGYYRGDEMCPMCGASNTRFLLKDEEIDSIGRMMAGVLRHFPERYGLEMDANGWVDLGEFITAVAIRNRRFRFLKPNHILGLVQTDPKGRYEVRAGRGGTVPGGSAPGLIFIFPVDFKARTFYNRAPHTSGRQERWECRPAVSSSATTRLFRSMGSSGSWPS